MAAAGSPPGRYSIGPYVVDVGEDRIVRLPSDRRFAGSSLALDQGVENIVKWLGVKKQKAVEMCSTLPARHFGIDL